MAKDGGRYFKVDGKTTAILCDCHQEILLEIIEQLRGIWSETDDFAEVTFNRNKRIILPSQTTPRQLESGEGSDVDSLKSKADVERLKRLLDTATGWN